MYKLSPEMAKELAEIKEMVKTMEDPPELDLSLVSEEVMADYLARESRIEDSFNRIMAVLEKERNRRAST